jgi:hypothetical protein
MRWSSRTPEVDITRDVVFDEEKMGFADTEQDVDNIAEICLDIPGWLKRKVTTKRNLWAFRQQLRKKGTSRKEIMMN